MSESSKSGSALEGELGAEGGSRAGRAVASRTLGTFLEHPGKRSSADVAMGTSVSQEPCDPPASLQCQGRPEARPERQVREPGSGSGSGKIRQGHPCTAAPLETKGKSSQVKEEQDLAEDLQGQTAAPHLSWS